MEIQTGGAIDELLGGQWNPSAFPDQAERLLARTCRMEPACAELKLFESEEPHARKPRNEMALNPLKTNDPAKS
jgi:hypothetical protein